MGNQYDDQDEDTDDLEAEGGDEAEVEEPDADEGDSAVSARGNGNAKNGDDSPEERTVTSRQALRDEMQRQIEEFLSRGGKITEVDPNVTSDPPRKPESDYGSRPI